MNNQKLFSLRRLAYRGSFAMLLQYKHKLNVYM